MKVESSCLIASSIVRQLAPVITNSFPIKLKFSANVPLEDLNIYIDDVLQKDIRDSLTLDSGVHHLEFVCKDYITAASDYYFEGNRVYDIKVTLRERQFFNINLYSQDEEPGKIFVAGKPFEGSIEIDNQPVLGQFYVSDKKSDFFIIDNTKLEDGAVYEVKADLIDKNSYIEKRRRWMYTSYSILITSLLPTFYLNGQSQIYNQANALGYLKTSQQISEANAWILASNISTGVSVACGIWFIYELVRYLYAANSVLPKEVKQIEILNTDTAKEIKETESEESPQTDENVSEKIEDSLE